MVGHPRGDGLVRFAGGDIPDELRRLVGVTWSFRIGHGASIGMALRGRLNQTATLPTTICHWCGRRLATSPNSARGLIRKFQTALFLRGAIALRSSRLLPGRRTQVEGRSRGP